MPADLSRVLVIGISSRALFDLNESNAVFENQGLQAYVKYQFERAEDILAPGTGFPLIKAILALNTKASGQQKAQVVVISRNNTATSLRIFNSIKHYGLPIERAVLSGGAPPAKYLDAFNVDLFLSCSDHDVREALAAEVPAALIYHAPENMLEPPDQIRIAFDGDAVVFSSESERVYQEKGMEAFVEHEIQKAKEILPDGPFAKLLRTLCKLQKDDAFTKPPIRTALITARSMPTHERVLRTLQAWDVQLDEAFFMGGVPKTKVLGAFRPHIFFDDQKVHCDPASKVVPTGQVPCLEPLVVDTATPEIEPETVASTSDCDENGETFKTVEAEGDMSDQISVKISFNTDDDGFLSQECPNCQKRFKVKYGEGSDKPISFCPYCAHEDQNCWWTEAQADYMTAVASKTVIEPELEKMARDFNREAGSGGFISMKMDIQSDPMPIPPEEPSEPWPILLFDCCNERIRYDQNHAELHCVICGKTTQLKMD